MSDGSKLGQLLPLPVCTHCGLAGHTKSTCPDRPGDSIELVEEAA